jgi:hypothetical protein
MLVPMFNIFSMMHFSFLRSLYLHCSGAWSPTFDDGRDWPKSARRRQRTSTVTPTSTAGTTTVRPGSSTVRPRSVNYVAKFRLWCKCPVGFYPSANLFLRQIGNFYSFFVCKPRRECFPVECIILFQIFRLLLC